MRGTGISNLKLFDSYSSQNTHLGPPLSFKQKANNALSHTLSFAAKDGNGKLI